MNVQDFINRYVNRASDFDGYYGAQCVDLVQFYSKELGYQRFTGNAVNIWDQPGTNYLQAVNSPSFVPQAGDIVIWNRAFGNGFGHCAIANGNGNKDWFESLDQNWGRPAAQIVRHNYNGVIGVLRPRKLVEAPPPPSAPAPVHTVTVVIPNLQVRKGAGTSYAGNQANTPDGMLHAGMVVNVAGQVTGGDYSLNGQNSNQWYRSMRGNFFAVLGCK